jgi:hypothetical protein
MLSVCLLGGSGDICCLSPCLHQLLFKFSLPAQLQGGPSEEKFLDIAAILQEASSESGNFIFEDDLDEFMV